MLSGVMASRNFSARSRTAASFLVSSAKVASNNAIALRRQQYLRAGAEKDSNRCAAIEKCFNIVRKPPPCCPATATTLSWHASSLARMLSLNCTSRISACLLSKTDLQNSPNLLSACKGSLPAMRTACAGSRTKNAMFLKNVLENAACLQC